MLKKIGVIAAVLMACFMMGAHAEGEDMEMLTAKGKSLVTSSGETVQLRGVNAGGWLVQEAWMTLTNAPSQTEAFKVLDERFGRETRDRLFSIYEDNYWKESDFDNVKALGMNVLRLPFAWWNILTDDGALRDDAFNRLDWFVDNCRQRGIYVILDLHAAPGSQNGNDHSGDITGANLWGSEENKTRTVYLWEQVAAHYKGNATVAAYDLMNEPTGGAQNATMPAQWDFFDVLYKAIRAIDPDHVISIESCWEPENLPAPSKYGWENVMYQYHYYKWGADNDFTAQKLFTRVKMAKLQQVDHGVPVLVGEFTLFRNMDAWTFALDTYNQEGLNWTIWTYKVTGRSTWGLYNVFGEKADIYNDSAERIEKIWREGGVMRRNDELCQTVANVLAGKPVDLPKEDQSVSSTPILPIDLINAAASKGATLSQRENALCLTTLFSRDPGTDLNAFRVALQEETNVASYTYLTFFIKDLHGSNTHKVTLIDSAGGLYSAWVDIPSVHKQWTRVNMPLSSVTGVDLTRLAQIGIGEWNSGDYLFDKIYFCVGALDE